MLLPTLLSASDARAASYDPELHWRTISTEHFDIHFHQGIEQVADEFAGEAERIYATLTHEVQWEPRRAIQLVLVDRTDSANGYATAIPYPAITIYVTAPTEGSSLNLYEDWGPAILTHELTHVLHMDANHGVVSAVRAALGTVVSTNSVSPLWMIEGYATFEETRYTDGGRGRAAIPDMLKRTAVLAGDFPPLGNLDGFQPDPPSGNLRYLWGQDFIQYLSEHDGPQAFTRWIHTYGGWVPFWLPTRRAFGESLWHAYNGWKIESEEKYLAQARAIEAEGVTGGRLVSDPRASCSAPAFSPDGEKLVWSCYDLKTGSAIWMSDGDGFGPEVLLQNNGAGYFTWRSDSKAFVFAALHLVNQFNTWSDIYLYPLGGSASALTNGSRARDPDFAPDGTELLYVTNKAQVNQLEIMTVDRRSRTLTSNTDHTQYSTPRYSPDGKVVALSVWQGGQRDLWLYDRKGQPARRLTMDAAIDADPMWSADGRWLFFDSDRTGVPNVYAIDMQTERLYQVTNVLTGAVKPTIHPSGKRMAYMEYSEDGFDVVVMDLDPGKYLDRGLLPQPIRHGAPLDTLVTPVVPPAPPKSVETEPVEAPPAETHEVAPVAPGSAPPPPETPQGSVGWAAPDGATVPTWESGTGTGTGTGTGRLRGPALRMPGTTPFVGFRGVGHAGHGVPDALAAFGVPGSVVAPQSTEVLDNFGDTEVEDAFGEEKDYPFRITPHRYNPGSSMIPRYLFPYFQTTPYAARPGFGSICVEGVYCRGIAGSLSTSATDVLSRYSWGAVLSYRTDAQYLGGGIGFTVNRFLPVYAFGVSTVAVATGVLNFVDPDNLTTGEGGLAVYATDPPYYYWEKRSTAYAVVGWPYRLRSSVFAQYSFTDRRPRFGIPENTYEPTIPFIGYVGELAGGYRYEWSEPTLYAISLEDGRLFSFVGSIRTPYLGAFSRNRFSGDLEPFSQLQVTSEIREYWTNPLLKNHVLAVRAAAGVTFGSTEFFGNYLLGGAIGDSGLLATPDEFRMVRGYPYAYDIGDMYWLAEGEYRFPLLRIERGSRTLPLYTRTLSAAGFVDVANAFNDPALQGSPGTARDLLAAATEEPMVGVGGEATFRFVIWWNATLTGRLGYGVGLTGDGFRPDPNADRDGDGKPDGPISYLYPAYLQLGASF